MMDRGDFHERPRYPTLEEVQRFIDGAEDAALQLQGKGARCEWTEQTLKRFRYRNLRERQLACR